MSIRRLLNYSTSLRCLIRSRIKYITHLVYRFMYSVKLLYKLFTSSLQTPTTAPRCLWKLYMFHSLKLFRRLRSHSASRWVANSLSVHRAPTHDDPRKRVLFSTSGRNSKRASVKTAGRRERGWSKLAGYTLWRENRPGREKRRVDRSFEACSTYSHGYGSAQLARSRDKGATDGFGSRRRTSFLSFSSPCPLFILHPMYLSFFFILLHYSIVSLRDNDLDRGCRLRDP